jgi:uncharacterized protein
MLYKPAFTITANGVQWPAAIAQRVRALDITDELGVFADTLRVTLHNADRLIDLPDVGASLEVALGYDGALTPMGRYVVDEATLAWPEGTLQLTAKAADMVGTFKTTRNASYHDTTLGAVLQQVAARHGLRLAVADALAQEAITHLDQSYESDLSLLTRLAQQYGATAKPAGGALVFVPRLQGTRADGTRLQPVAVDASNAGYAAGADVAVSGWSVTRQSRDTWASVRAHWVDGRNKKTETYVYAGEGEPQLALRHPYKSDHDAQVAADARLRKSKQGQETLTLKLRGNARLCAEMPITLTGASAAANGEWLCTQVTHSYTSSGFTTTLQAQRGDDEAAIF